MVRNISFKDAYVDFWKRALDFSGRSSRKEYWFPMLVNIIILLSIWTICTYIDGQLGIDPESRLSISNIVYKTLSFFFSIGVLSVSVRRLHDTNLSGIIAIVPGVLVMIIVLISMLLNQFGVDTERMISIAMPICLIGIVIIYLVLLLRDGTHGPNEYGEDPINR